MLVCQHGLAGTPGHAHECFPMGDDGRGRGPEPGYHGSCCSPKPKPKKGYEIFNPFFNTPRPATS